MMFRVALILLIGITLSVNCQEDIVTISNGVIKGVVDDIARAFKGIPYAQPPTGQNGRWQPPRAANSWNGVLDASQYSAGCPQDCKLPPKTCPARTSEDCLYLNVFTPRLSNLNTPQPVMVFLHGGRFEQGATGTILYDGTFMANMSNTIIVTVNYRIGALGWLVTGAGANDLHGNYGLMDQRLALQWVQQNIAAFGGDPKTVTLFGQSAGGSSTTSHLISPKSKGLFQRAIIQSNPIQLPLKPLKDGAAVGDVFVKSLGCNKGDYTCIRSKPVSAVLQAQKDADHYVDILRPLELFMPWTPSIDNDNLFLQPLDAFRTGSYQKMPIMIGTVSQEALMFIFLASPTKNITTVEYSAILLDVFFPIFASVISNYPPIPTIGDKRPQLAVLGSDYIFNCPLRNSSMNIAKNTNSPVYVYEFNHVISFSKMAWGPNYTFCDNAVCHGSELCFLFNAAAPAGFPITQDEIKLSVDMAAYWTNFARTGDPNKGYMNVSPVWPQFSSSNLQTLELMAPNSKVVSKLYYNKCNYWDSKGYGLGW